MALPFASAKMTVYSLGDRAEHLINEISEIRPIIAACNTLLGYDIALTRNGYEFSAEYSAPFEMEISVVPKDQSAPNIAVVAKCTYKYLTDTISVKKMAIILNVENDQLAPDEISSQMDRVIAELRSVYALAAVFNKKIKPTYKIIGCPSSVKNTAEKRQFAAYKAAAKGQMEARDIIALL
jgi:hypothetical protein